MEAKHTPGPWRIEETTALELPIRGPGDEFIAVVFLDEYAPDGECEANVNLIVAAPGLLAACESALTAINQAQGEWAAVNETFAPEWTHDLKEVASYIEAAIAAARRKP
jgi:hypothetical protein